MRVSGEEGAVPRAEKRPEMAAVPVSINTGTKWGKGIGCGLVFKAAGYLDRSQKRHGMAHGAAGKQYGVAGAYTRRNAQGRVEGPLS